MATENDIPIKFVPLNSTVHARRGHLHPRATRLLVYEAIYAEPHEAPVSLGLFVSIEAAQDACRRLLASNPSWLEYGELRVDERMLENSE